MFRTRIPSLRSAAWCLLAALATLASLGSAPATSVAPQAITSPAGPNSETPQFARGSDGRVWLSWVEARGEGGHALRVARWEGDHFGPARTVAAGDSFQVGGADPASVQPLGGGVMAAQWRKRSAGEGHAMDVQVGTSASEGAPAQPIMPHADRSAVEHGFASLAPAQGGALLVWLDGRAFAAAGGGHGHESEADADMQLRAVTLAANGAVGPEQVIDGRVCECCGTAMTVTSRGPLLAFRDRAADERRDIALARWENGRWSQPWDLHRDGWIIKGCPVNGPSLDADGASVVAAWFTDARDSARVLAAFSSDAGEKFAEPVQVSSGEPIGRASVARLSDGSAVVAWLVQRDKLTVVQSRRVEPQGRLGPVRELATLPQSRGAGIPRVARDGDRLVFAWTETGTARRVRTASMPVSAFGAETSKVPRSRGAVSRDPRGR